MKIHLEDIVSVKTAHGVGEKFVFLNKENVFSNLTQVAMGVLTNKDDIDFHLHPTMEEFYFFMEGKATFVIGNETFDCEPNTFIYVPYNVKHKLTTNKFIKFLYWGVAI